MKQLSIDLLKDPYNLKRWENLLASKELEVSKSSPDLKLKAVRSIYDNFLLIYPLLENYWIKYAKVEYELGNFPECEAVYDKGFQYLSHSVYFWVSYLNFKLSCFPVCQSNCLDYLKLFEKARNYIGLSYYSSDFYKLYLEFLSTYESFDKSLNFRLKYEILLRYIIEVPNHNYSTFFSMLLDEIENGSMKFIQDRGLRKNVNDIYVTTQYKSYKLYDFEKKLQPYFDVSYISINELKVWEKYLDYSEMNYPHAFVVQLYERAVIRTANYDDIWMKYMDYLTGLQKYDSLNDLIKRALSIKRFNKSKLMGRLIDLNLFSKDYLLAKSLLGNEVDINKVVALEWLFKNEQVLSKLFEVSQPWDLLLYYNIDNKLKLQLFKKCKNKTEHYNRVLQLWLKYNPQFKHELSINNNEFDDELGSYL